MVVGGVRVHAADFVVCARGVVECCSRVKIGCRLIHASTILAQIVEGDGDT